MFEAAEDDLVLPAIPGWPDREAAPCRITDCMFGPAVPAAHGVALDAHGADTTATSLEGEGARRSAGRRSW